MADRLTIWVAPATDEPGLWCAHTLVDRHGDRHHLTKDFPTAQEAADSLAEQVRTYPWDNA